MDKVISKVSNSSTSILKNSLKLQLSHVVDEVRRIIMEDYNLNLTSFVTDSRSKTNPGLPKYIDAFRDALYNFPMLEIDNSVSVNVPDMESFKFDNSKLRVIQTILEGVVGKYVEVTIEQYIKMYNKPSSSIRVLDPYSDEKDSIYILRYTADVQNRERIALGKRGILVPYPFSNTPPIDIFGNANKYVEDNLGFWIEKAIEDFNKGLQKMYN